MPSLRISCALAILVGACGADSKDTPRDGGQQRADAGETPKADADIDDSPATSEGGMAPAPAGNCFEANKPFDAKAATLFAKLDLDTVTSLYPVNERLFFSSSESLLEIVAGKTEPVLVAAKASGAAHLFGNTWYFIDRTTVSRMDAGTAGTTPTQVRSDLVDLPYLRVVGAKAVYQQLESGVKVFPLDGSAAFMLPGPSSIDGGAEYAGLFYYFDHDADRPFRVEPKTGAVPEVLSAGDDTFGDFGGAIATNGKYVVWEVGSGRLKGTLIGKPNGVSTVASVPTQHSFNDGVYDLTFVGDRLYFSFDRTEDKPTGGKRTFTNIAYATPGSDACAVVVSDLWSDGKYQFILSESRLWILTLADGSIYSQAL